MMTYADMLHEQENQTWFEVEDAMSAVPVQLSICGSEEDYWPDCIEIAMCDNTPIMIGASDALNILKWLEYHRKRLENRQVQQLRAMGIENS